MALDKSQMEDEMEPVYDFSDGVRGKHAQAYQRGHRVIIHKTDGSTEVHPVDELEQLGWLHTAESAFDFWNDPEEDIYNDLTPNTKSSGKVVLLDPMTGSTFPEDSTACHVPLHPCTLRPRSLP